MEEKGEGCEMDMWQERFDPASLLPFSCRLIPDDKTIERIPLAYRGSINRDVFTDRGPIS